MAGKNRGRPMNGGAMTARMGVLGWSKQDLATNAGVPFECVEKSTIRNQRTNDNVIALIATALGVNENAIT